MKSILLALLLIPSILFAQEPVDEPTESEVIEIDIDPRCKSAVMWGASLIVSKQSGMTLQSVQNKLNYDYRNGPLKGASPDVMMYMHVIVSYVFEFEGDRTTEEIVVALKEVNEICVTFMNYEPVAPKTSA